MTRQRMPLKSEYNQRNMAVRGNPGKRVSGLSRVRLCTVSADPIEDASDPVVILRSHPERERGEFLQQYRTVVDAARDPSGYEQLRRPLHGWSLTVIGTNQPGYYDDIAAERAGTSATMPVTSVIPDWPEWLAALGAAEPSTPTAS
jgi:hypothetical protein